MRILSIGGSGFIGTNFYKAFKDTHQIAILDKLLYPSTLQNGMWDMDLPTYWHGDITDQQRVADVIRDCAPDVVINFAADTHVDNSIHGGSFIPTNIIGVENILKAIKDTNIRLLQFSTDEVYGDCDPNDPTEFSEDAPLKPSSPYSASKAAADMLCAAYHRTFGVDVVTVRPTNNYGPYQYPEKLIPFLIKRSAVGKTLPLYGDGLQKREWLYVEDCVRAVELIARVGKSGEVYNIGSGVRVTNKQIAEAIGGQISFIEDRPGHDLCYAVDSSKTAALGWKPQATLQDALSSTVEWYTERLSLLDKLQANPHIP